MKTNEALVAFTKKKFFSPFRQILFSLSGSILLVIAGISFLPAKISAQTNPNIKWLGNYVFENMAQGSMRQNSFDVVPIITYDIFIEKAQAGNLRATINENGIQTYQAYQCTVKTADDKIEFYYEKFVAEGVKDTRELKSGELLFSLTAKRVGKATKYLFQPGALKIILLNKAKQRKPIYFKKN
jgi:hypothetical protein